MGTALIAGCTGKEIAKANLDEIRDDPSYRSRLLEETRSALRAKPDVIGMGELVDQVERRYELELYKWLGSP